MKRSRILQGAVTGLVASVLLATATAQQSTLVPPADYAQLRWRYIGPEGNRVSAVTGVPGEPATSYAGSASGEHLQITPAQLLSLPPAQYFKLRPGIGFVKAQCGGFGLGRKKDGTDSVPAFSNIPWADYGVEIR